MVSALYPAVLAYLDPGTGSLILQVILATFFGLLMTIKLWWTRFSNFVRSILGRKKADGHS